MAPTVSHSLHGLAFTSPEGFVADELMVSMMAPDAPELQPSPTMLQKKTVVRTNLIVHRRSAPAGVGLDMLAGELLAELMTSIQGLTDPQAQPFSFGDGAPGRLIAFDYATREGVTLRQYQAARLDAGELTTLTVTVDRNTLNEKAEKTWLDVLGSLRPDKKR